MKKTSILVICMIIALTLNIYAQETVTHTVTNGETLWTISKKYATTVDELKRLNSLKSDTIIVGQKLIVAKTATETIVKPYVNYVVKKGDTVGKLAEYFGVTIETISALNGLKNNIIYVGETIKIPTEYIDYTVKSGDTLFKLAQSYNTTIDKIKVYSGFDFDYLIVAQKIKIPGKPKETIPPPTPTDSAKPAITYKTHVVVRNDTIWSISVKCGVPMTELLSVNKLNMESMLNLGQSLKIPVHTIPIKPTPGPKYGEYLDWWTEAQYVVPINKEFTVKDFLTGKTFKIKRTVGAGHADCEPMTKADTAIIKGVWGGFSWNTRSVLVLVDGRQIAASMSFYPHDVEYIRDNDFNGHFDLYFGNCIRHVDGKPDSNHENKVKIAAGIQ